MMGRYQFYVGLHGHSRKTWGPWGLALAVRIALDLQPLKAWYSALS
jgi:hypothetical protein